MTPKRAKAPRPHSVRGWHFERMRGGEVHFWQKVGDLTTAEFTVTADEWDAIVDAVKLPE